MIRLIAFWVIVSAILAAVFHIPVWWFAAPLGILLILAYTVGGLRAQCPRCGQSVKIGFDTCRYCGWTANP